MGSRAALVRSARNRKAAVQAKTTPAPARMNGRGPRFVMCVDAGEHAGVDLEVGKVYQALPTDKTDRANGFLRVIDNSGEDYLFNANKFVEVKLPRAGQMALLKR